MNRSCISRGLVWKSLKLLVFFVLLSTGVQVLEGALGADSALAELQSVSARYYKALESQTLDEKVVTLNDLSEILIIPEKDGEGNQLSESQSMAKRRALEHDSRWGKKLSQSVLLYRIVDFEEVKENFSKLFGKQVRSWQVVCVTYTRTKNGDDRDLKIKYAESFDSNMFSKLDLWIQDEDGKWHVLLGYRPCLPFNENLSIGAAKRLGLDVGKVIKTSSGSERK